MREEMQVELRAIQKNVGITTIMVTHDQAEALSICDRIAIVDKGRIVQLGTPRALYDLPATDFVATFVGRTNRLTGRLVGGSGDELTASVDATDAQVRLRAPADPVSGDQKILLPGRLHI
ncbi:hypothetical protein [Mesorhizobium sp. CN2-181]|uniref:hypothetical protein n=1 Tax=Mesorhizobium yinganensis TaxID=3157707 RepID=UPI0032B721B6